MVQPSHVHGPALVPLAAQRRGLLARARDDDAALARRELLVRVKRERREVAARAHANALGVHRAKRFAGVLEDAEPPSLRELLELRHRRGIAKDVHGQDADRPLSRRRLRRVRVEVQRDRVDVREDRHGVLEQEAVGGCHEAERRGHDLVSRPPAEAPNPEVERRGPRRDRDGVVDAQPCGEVVLEAILDRSEREPAGPQNLEHELFLARAEVRPGERDLVRCAQPTPRPPSADRCPEAGTRTPANRPGPPTKPR